MEANRVMCFGPFNAYLNPYYWSVNAGRIELTERKYFDCGIVGFQYGSMGFDSRIIKDEKGNTKTIWISMECALKRSIDEYKETKDKKNAAQEDI